MTVKFKSERKSYLFDSVSGRIIPISRLEGEVFSLLDLPMPALCPTSLRYELARYDSQSLSEAYSALYALYKNGDILSDNDSDAVIKICYDQAVSEATAKNAVNAFALASDKSVTYTLKAEIYPDEAKKAAIESGLILS